MAVIIGTIANDTLTGTAGNDTVTGNVGNDSLSGGAGNDTLTGGDGDDQVFGENGNDLMVWNPGDDTDLFEGGADIDTAMVNGGTGAEVFTVTANGTRVRFDRLDPAPFSLDIGTTEHLVVKANGGNDFFSATGNLAALIQLTVDGGAGNDTILGTNGADTLLGGTGNDFIDGQQGNDVAFLGAGNDTFQWDPGDGSDTVEGQAGFDALRFNGSAGAEIMEISANGARTLLTRNLGNIVMDLNDVERVQLQALGGADTITVQDLAGTDVKQVAINLAGTIGGTAGDGQADTVIVNGNGGNNTINVAQVAGAVTVTGLVAQTTIAAAEAANDSLVVNGLAGNDTINASKLAAGVVGLTLDGGLGNDKITGSLGSDVILGGDGNDTVAGGAGDDVAFLGAGNDLFQWNPGDGNDTVEGQDGFDTLRFAGSAADEEITVAANGGRVFLLRNVAAAVLDLDDIERLEIGALGGSDAVVVDDLTGTDVAEVAIDLAADGKVDSVTVHGTNGNDIVSVASLGGQVVIEGLAAGITVSKAGKADILTVNALGGDDIIDASRLAAGKIGLAINGGLGDDIVLGSAGADTVNGGDGDDLAFLGAGNDMFVWNPGDDNDTIEGQAGTDTLHFNGANAAENIDISANGGRALFFRNIANVTMDMNDVERIEYQALGGADHIAVNDLSGTDVKHVGLNLAASGGAGDGMVDTVIRNAGSGDDTINVALVGATISVTGLSAQLAISGAEAANDGLTINGLAGNDKINASTLPASVIRLGIDGGVGNDTIVGSADSDILFGGDDNDTVTGGGGDDTAILGTGDDLFVWKSGDGNDTIEGQAGTDMLRVTGASADENIDIVANGGRVLLSRNVAAVLLDLDDVERLEVRALGGVDNIAVGDLGGTDVTEVAIDLAAAAGGKAADTRIDTVTVNATNGADVFTVSNSGGKVTVTGLAAQVSIDHAGKTDRLVINAFGDNDVIDATGLAAGKIALTMNGGLGDDVFLGSAGNDTVNGGDGDDTALLGAGDDLFVWNPGDDNDTIEGQAGTDTLHFNGANAAENIDISANGGRALFFRNVANVLMDMNDVERIQFNALGGADNITVNDLSGTDVKQVAIDLAAAGGAGDGLADNVTALGTAGNDSVIVSLAAGAVTVKGLAAQISIAHAELANDQLIINGLGGNDTINASALPASTMRLFLVGSDGNDTITGNAGDNILDGGADNDVLNGGGGSDLLFGGSGNDTINGATGNDTVTGGIGDDSINLSSGNDTVRYTSGLDGNDVLTGFDGNAAGGQDTLDLDVLFDNLTVATLDRAGRVSVTDNGASVTIAVDADGNLGNGFELAVATLKTPDAIAIGQDILVGTL
jgi:Ca2+-binding RTX toxin-like protein